MSKQYGIKVLDLAGTTVQPNRQVPVGKWLSKADVDYAGGRGMADFSIFPTQALRFDSMQEAWAFWQQQSTVKPLREDGQPNRPLTAFTVEVCEVP